VWDIIQRADEWAQQAAWDPRAQRRLNARNTRRAPGGCYPLPAAVLARHRAGRPDSIDPVTDADGALTARQYDAMGEACRTANDARGVTAYYERPATIGLLGDVRGKRVLDAGCGPGALSGWLAGQGAIVTAVDISPEMVRIAHDRLGDSARVLLADLARPLDFAADAGTDLIVASLAMHYLADWDAPLAEFCRILAPGGAVVFSTTTRPLTGRRTAPGTTSPRSRSPRPGTSAGRSPTRSRSGADRSPP
jgi:SAM-dependent methyltransferase